MLLHSEGQLCRIAVDFVLDFERVIDTRQSFSFREFDVHNGSDDLSNVSCIHKIDYEPSAICAVAISRSSVVMLACRILLYSRVRSLINSLALSVAFFIATMRALCSDARASRIIWKTWY